MRDKLKSNDVQTRQDRRRAKNEPPEIRADPLKGARKTDPLTPEGLPEKVQMTDLERIEGKLDEILHLLGKGRGRTAAELGREADAIILRLQTRQEQKARKK